MTPDRIYTRPGPLTGAGKHAKLLDALPRELPALTRAVQGLVIHEYLTEHYGVQFSEERKLESQLRTLEGMLGAVLQHDARPLTAARPPEQRFCGVCRHFTLLLMAALRHQGVPARARVGFGGYFTPGGFEDHWVCEYWNASQDRWVLVDAQLDDVLRKLMNIDFDPLDVPRDRFVIAYDAWQQARSGRRDPHVFRFSPVNLSGLWFIAANMIKDAAALNGIEVLPWDVWGGMVRGELSTEQLTFFDRLAGLTRTPDEKLDALRQLFRTDARLRIGPEDEVLNDRLSRRERLAS
ncbi:MAG TPA: transglutaminase-like domain-containing protein [Polyangiales bacterium]|nr:transglutaminase-like domain-containing protein [Polyangiales bacterium]